MEQFDGHGPDASHGRGRPDVPTDAGHECQRNPRPTTDEAGTSGELWKRTYECAYHGCSRVWTEWYAPVFDEVEGWVNDHGCGADDDSRAPELDLTTDAIIVDEGDTHLVIEGVCPFCNEDDVQVRFERDTMDVHD